MAYTSNMRFAGLNSGVDTETLVSNMMKAQSLKLNKLKKSATKLTWKQEQYRSVYSELKSFQSSFLDVMKSGSLRKESTFSKLINSVKTKAGADSGAVTVGSGSATGKYSIRVQQLAVADLYKSASKLGGDIRSEKSFKFDVSNIKDGACYEITLDGASKKISFSEGDAVSGGTLTFVNGSIGVKSADGTVKRLDEQGFIDVFNEKLKSTFGMEGTDGKQKIEAKLTANGGVSIFTNGYHSGFSVADGNYVYSSATAEGKSALASGAATENRDLRFTVKIGGVTTNINVSVTEGMTEQDLIEKLNEKLEEKGLDDKVFFHIDSQTGTFKVVNFSTTEDTEINGDMEYLGFDGGKVELSPSGSLNSLGITSGSVSTFDTSRTLSEVFGSSLTGETSFTINGKSFSFTGDTKISDIISEVNNAGLGVTMRYDEYSQTLQLESDKTGHVNKISMSGSLLTDNFGFGTTAARAAADSIATINGTTLTRSSNDFSFMGVDWKLNETTGDDELTVTVSKDVDSVVDTIKSFVQSYNALLESLNKITSASRPKYNGSHYDPLLDEEKAEMTEKEIEQWEKNAKTGLLRNDSIIREITSSLRTALGGSVTLEDGSKISLFSIGITTSSSMSKSGQLQIDEDKLRSAIEKYGDGIATLFTAASSESGKGIAERVNDVVNRAAGRNGTIAIKAGIEGTETEYNNLLYSKLKTNSDAQERMISRLKAKETYYYNLFARMEAAMSRYDSQSQYLSSMFGGNQ